MDGGNVCAVIMAGGKGERFWPYSRVDRPKQFLTVIGDRSLLQQTVARAARLAGAGNVYVVTGEEYVDLVAAQLPQLPSRNVICEPVGRDTAPCIGLASLYVSQMAPEAVMVVLPADHLILNEERFQNVMRTATKAAMEEGTLVTVGIRPTRPETGYGYIRYAGPVEGRDGVCQVSQFTEKPDQARALSFLQSGDFLWNSGMFAWRVDVIRRAMAEHLPELAAGLRQIEKALGTAAEEEVLRGVFPGMPRISLDYGILEREQRVLVVPGDFGWDDLGSWTALERVDGADANGNLVNSEAVLVDTAESIIRGSRPNKLVATLGLRGAVVVDTEDVLLVADKRRVGDLKIVIAELKARGLQRYLETGLMAMEAERPEDRKLSKDPAGTAEKETVLSSIVTALAASGPQGVKVVEKPWGRELWWAMSEDYVGKIIEVEPGHSLSRQYHRQKRETMMFIKGQGEMEFGDQILVIESGLIVDISPDTVHRVTARSQVVFLEVSSPQVDDVVRLDDKYGRIRADVAN